MRRNRKDSFIFHDGREHFGNNNSPIYSTLR